MAESKVLNLIELKIFRAYPYLRQAHLHPLTDVSEKILKNPSMGFRDLLRKMKSGQTDGRLDGGPDIRGDVGRWIKTYLLLCAHKIKIKLC